MSLKTKLTSLITTFVLLCSLLTVGVFAVKNTTFNVGGDIVFNVQGIEATIELVSLQGAELPEDIEAGTDVMKPIALANDKTASEIQSQFETWSNLDLTFAEGQSTATIEIKITNNTQVADNNIYINIGTSFVNANNCEVSVNKTSSTILPGGNDTFIITFKVTDDGYSANIEGFLIDFNMKQSTLMQYDTENNYYYVEMGSYNGNPVRWRYVSDVTNGIDTAVRFDPTTSTPNSTTGSKGMFILESDIFTADTLIYGTASTDTNDGIIEFLPSKMYAYASSNHTTEGYTDVYANDYAASNLRAFLTGRTNVAGQDVGNLMNVIGIDSNNAIYQKIQGRTLTDLYSTINQDGSTLTLPSQFDGSATDMFWSLSYNEALTILGGGSSMQNELFWKSPAHAEYMKQYVAPEEYWNASYRLRSPDSSNSEYSYAVYYVGDFLNGSVGGSLAARPAFILEF